MRFIPTRIHGILDYLVGAVLILAPFIFGFATGGAAQWTPILIGAAIIISALFTDFELGVVRKMPMQGHLGLDVVLGIVLAVSPWLFAFSAVVWVPHLIVGLALIGLGLTTQLTPAEAGPRRGRRLEQHAAS
ncbi:MAG: SPW repeat protein [Bradymonadaceae bacterium]|nr:SPW repeat protein [Lujinxingiaceae bacterium]